jgi:hypothetical protein
MKAKAVVFRKLRNAIPIVIRTSYLKFGNGLEN